MKKFKEKPPIGIVNRHFVDRLRLSDLRSAIARYYEAELKIPIEWIEEYNELIAKTI
tara:strand:+ start:711 stop:881 length:171 start_codon:yes stop_codon:yes gene_type:complete